MAEGWRTLVIEQKDRMELLNDNIVVRGQNEEFRFPVDQVRDMIVTYPSGSVTLPLLRRLSQEHINTVLCDERHTPCARLVGINQHSESAGRLMDQAEWPDKRKDAMWKQITRQKINMQASLLEKLGRPGAEQLRKYAAGVRLNDRTNREGLAAKVYFEALFGPGFVRHDVDAVNAALNYGYTILNTAVSRILTLHGYHTALGIHHRGRNNPVNLSCDIMEPFRPVVDSIVARSGDRELDRDYKKELIAVLQERCRFDGNSYKLADAADLFAVQVLDAMRGDRKPLGVIAFE